MSKLSMRRLMKKIARDCNNDIRFQSAAADALQKAVEAMLVN
jgi:histone H3/H4